MADIFVSHTRADQDIVRRIVALLEAQGWSVWWDTRISGGERWDATIEREITAADCVVVVWTPQSIDRESVHLEAHHGRERGILVSVLLGVDKPPFAFSPIPALALTGWDGVTLSPVAEEFLAEVLLTLGWSGTTATSLSELRASAAELTQELADVPARSIATGRPADEGRIKVDATVVHGAPDGWFLPGNGKTEWFKDIDVGPEMVVVPAGEFIMGSNEKDSEKPPHKVTIKAPFAVGRFAVTFDEWDAAGLAYKLGDQGWGRGRRPVISMSWEDAKAYADWLSQRAGKEYRLLSEAEWEYCCRAGTTTRYAFGDSITTSQAQFSEGGYASAGKTAEVGRFAPNAWGLYDLHGNVWEWCEDNWHANYKEAPEDGSVWAGGDVSLRVRRGGSWYGSRIWVRSTSRDSDQPLIRDDGVGFRVARTL